MPLGLNSINKGMKIRVIIYGQVQMVGFRNWVKRGMRKFLINGEVWNNEDGTVGGEFEGDKILLDKFIERCKKGSPLSRVKKVDILEI